MNNEQFVEAITPWLSPNEGPLRAHLTLAIRQAISTGQLAQGVRLPPERTLAVALHVSRPTISGVVEDLRTAGLISSRQGSGSWVSGEAELTRPAVPFVERVQATGSIDLASATAPDASLLPAMRIDTSDLLGAEPANGLTPVGLWNVRTAIAERASRFVPTAPDNVIVTSGAHQALALVIAALAPQGSTVLLEETTYGGLVDMVHVNGSHPIGIPRDADGPVPDVLRDLITKHRPSLIVLVSSVHSPTGVVSSPERCLDLAEVLRGIDARVVLDETYAELEFNPAGRPLSVALGPASIRTGSLSKSLWTGLRTGWIITDAATGAAIARRRWQQFDLGPSVPSQLFAASALVDLDDRLDQRRSHLLERSMWMMQRIAHDFPDWQVQKLDGGLALWVELPVDGEEYATFAESRGVALLPGSACRVDQRATPHIRICFDRPVDVLEQAFERLT
ncbi:MAG: DNA-binding transcriptional MocR family regulator [Verrucomicrobiales bacterium]|jgi:DNA-binding transcriptional MocR family regulator